MSLATRCPHCNTIFKVVQDQLKVSEGWVRCGRCSEVFNALEGLFDMEREPPPQRNSAPTTVVTTAEVSAPAVVEPPPAMQPPAPSPPPPAPPAPPPFTPVAAFPPVAPPPAALPPTPAPAFEDIALVDPQPDTVAERPGVTHFDLDLGAPSAPRPAEPDFGGQDAAQMAARVAAALPPSMRAPAPVEPPPPAPAMAATTAVDAPGDLPVTDEADALDSRYLLPSDNERRPPGRRRRRRGPDFADAEFPDDAMADDSDWSQSWIDTDAAALDSTASGPTTHAPLIEPVNRRVSAAPIDTAPEVPPVAAPPAVPTAPAPSTSPTAARDTGPTTIPSRFGDDYQPEQALPPPSQRRGKSGTRGRAPQAEAPEFIKQAERKALWRHPAVRALLGVTALGLSLALAGQAVHHWRDRIAASYPAAAPLLAQWCDVAGCTLRAPMQIEDLLVDNISLVRTTSEGADTYKLTAIIHNRADIPLAWPQLDLTLTDSNGSVVVRRAFTVDTARRLDTERPQTADGPVPQAVPPGGSTTLQWRLKAPDLQLASYTAELFYP